MITIKKEASNVEPGYTLSGLEAKNGVYKLSLDLESSTLTIGTHPDSVDVEASALMKGRIGSTLEFEVDPRLSSDNQSFHMGTDSASGEVVKLNTNFEVLRETSETGEAIVLTDGRTIGIEAALLEKGRQRLRFKDANYPLELELKHGGGENSLNIDVGKKNVLRLSTDQDVEQYPHVFVDQDWPGNLACYSVRNEATKTLAPAFKHVLNQGAHWISDSLIISESSLCLRERFTSSSQIVVRQIMMINDKGGVAMEQGVDRLGSRYIRAVTSRGTAIDRGDTQVTEQGFWQNYDLGGFEYSEVVISRGDNEEILVGERIETFDPQNSGIRTVSDAHFFEKGPEGWLQRRGDSLLAGVWGLEVNDGEYQIRLSPLSQKEIAQAQQKIKADIDDRGSITFRLGSDLGSLLVTVSPNFDMQAVMSLREEDIRQTLVVSLQTAQSGNIDGVYGTSDIPKYSERLIGDEDFKSLLSNLYRGNLGILSANFRFDEA